MYTIRFLFMNMLMAPWQFFTVLENCLLPSSLRKNEQKPKKARSSSALRWAFGAQDSAPQLQRSN